VSAFRPGPRLLHIGCGLGHLAALAKRRGWRVTGLDASASAVSHAAVCFDLDVRAGSLSRHAATLAPFDVVLLTDEFDLAPDLARLLVDVRKVLTPGGTLCIDTPHAAAGPRRRTGRPDLTPTSTNESDALDLSRLLASSGFRDIATASYASCPDKTRRSRFANWLRKLMSYLSSRFNHRLGRCHPAYRRPAPPRAISTLDDALDQLAAIRDSTAIVPHPSGDRLAVVARR
jgi:SAM-dependent methyltransferase